MFDTLTGYDPETDDPILSACNLLTAAVAARGAAIDRLRAKSDPPPAPLPPASPALAA